MDVLRFIILVFSLFDPVLCGSYCYDDGYSFYCDYGCCGNYGDEYCCGVYSWIVVVAVLGGIALISVAVIAFCYWKKKKMAHGRIINHPGQQQVHTTVIHGPPPGQMVQPPPYQQQPPMYVPQQQGTYPPPQSMNYGANPAYPPPGY